MEAQSKRLPYALKGRDAIFYSVFRHLGCAVDARPVLNMDAARKEEWDNKHAELSEDEEIEIPEEAESLKSSIVGVGKPKLQLNKRITEDGDDYVKVSDT